MDLVLESDRVTDQVKLVLLAYSTSMTDAGYVSVPREHIAQMLGKHPARITEALAAARKAGLLDRNGGGYRGRTAQYIAVLPTSKVTTTRSPIEPKGDGHKVTFFGHLSPAENAEIDGKVTATRSPNARVTNASTPTGTSRSARCVGAPYVKGDGAPSATICADRFAGRSCVCAGLRLVKAAS